MSSLRRSLAMSWLHPFKIEHRYAPIAWGLACAAIATLVTACAKLRVAGADIIHILWPVAMSAGVIAGLVLIDRRLANDPSRIAGILRGVANRGTDLLITACGIVLISGSGIVLSFQGAAAGLPLQDAAFARLDEAFGFHWYAVMAWFDANPAVAKSMRHFYQSAAWLFPGLFLLFVALGRTDRVREFSVLYAITLFAVISVSAGLPAKGAFAFYQPPADLVAHLTPKAGIYHLKQLDALRDGSLTVLRLEHATGLVTFPSFHTALAILAIYAVRGLRLLFWPVLALNAGVIVSTIPEGGHYAIDVVAGAVLTVAAIAGVRRWLAASWGREHDVSRLPGWLTSPASRPLGT
jgi:membrane-associated phospholipid phosphatase